MEKSGYMTSPSKRVYTPVALMADLRYLWDGSEEVGAAMSGGRVSKAFGKRIMLAVTAVNDCRYCSYAHAKTSAAHGVTREEADRLLAGDVGTVPEKEIRSVLFAQHYAETGGNPDHDMVETLQHTYGPDVARDILAHIRMIPMGNLSGNTLDALLSRMRGSPAEGSRLVDELAVLGLLLTAPLIAAAGLVRRAVRRIGRVE